MLTGYQALMGIRYNTSPPGPTFVPSLDAALLHLRPHPGSSSLRRGDLVEIVGTSGSGKSSLITFLILITILSATLPAPLSTNLGGKEAQAMLFQPNTHRPILPLIRRAMEAHIKACAPGVEDDMVNSVIKDSMSRLRIWTGKPRWKDLALGIQSVLDETSPYTFPLSNSGHALDLLAIDGLSDAYYLKRWSEEERGRRQQPHLTGKAVEMEDIGLRQVMEAIGAVRKELGSVVVMSAQSLRVSRDAQPFHLPHLPPPYPSPFASSNNLPLSASNPMYWPLNIQLSLMGRSRGLQLPGDTMIADALRVKARERNDKAEDTRGDTYNGLVRMVRSDGALLGKEGIGFHFRVGNEGLQAWGDE
ncbi:hypothetical protein L198_05064 [Cryptococcus wingfieldii CBS 7118]|uniref:P-loop containing nucleoside triphosphate hydrolase protein n=1 Tax=Cryptococcus wingfieldii CBS 7118 TaxID=1295528 RepID=A0A1E3J002_9TREE|nr:hypothetical protein L198_05064 [Cryptococcus wingfieldii CBS 7118]ODN94210.1 hypothetical protein L198_05064 [Cryptococcus wingfieldii CBS 7118]